MCPTERKFRSAPHQVRLARHCVLEVSQFRSDDLHQFTLSRESPNPIKYEGTRKAERPTDPQKDQLIEFYQIPIRSTSPTEPDELVKACCTVPLLSFRLAAILR